MKRIISIALAAFSLAGCATFQADLAKLESAYTVVTTATVSPSIAQISISSFQVLETAATEYFKYCKKSPADSRCDPGTIAQPGPLRIAIKYDLQGRKARDQVKAAGKSGALISSTVYSALTDAVANLTSNTPVQSFGAAK